MLVRTGVTGGAGTEAGRTEVLHPLHSGRGQGSLQHRNCRSDRCHHDKSLGLRCSAVCPRAGKGTSSARADVLWGSQSGQNNRSFSAAPSS